jgi:2,4-dienoyl-CoA reductase-like NADH-dependent reductase (Old Yellow Enzyme family)
MACGACTVGTSVSQLFDPLTLRGTTIPNRIWTAPMCQYSSVEGRATSWHHTHLVSRAVGGSGLVITEATAITPEGRISPQDAGIWTDAQAESYTPIVADIAAAGAVAGIQLAHAGRKGSTWAPDRGTGAISEADGGWQTVGASALGYDDWPAPRPLTEPEIAQLARQFAAATTRAVAAGFRVVEVHAAHGYLLHQFLSPLSNVRTDSYGGSLENRLRLPLEVLAAVRGELPDDLPLLLRVSATDWAEGGWDLDQTVELARRAKEIGVDLVDVSSAGLTPAQRITVGPGYQVPFAQAIRERVGVPTGAVGLITDATQAEDVLATGAADAVLLARQLLREPYFPLRAAHELDADVPWPAQYSRAHWR